MPKGDRSEALKKRLQKLEQAHRRLGALAARVQAQADAVADLLREARGHAATRSAPAAKRPGRPRKVAAPGATKRAARRSPSAAAAPTRRAASATAPSTAPRPATARRTAAVKRATRPSAAT